MKIWSDDAILAELGDRLRSERLGKNISQKEVATAGGVSIKTLHNLESGEGSSLTTLVRVLRALGSLDRLDLLVPPAEPSPMQLLELSGSNRMRASRSPTEPPSP
jgi:transcriptional regulator with XRE-family HTH domain